MNRGLKGLIVAGSIFLGVGLTVGLVGFCLIGFNVANLSTIEKEDKTYKVDDISFTNIEINEITSSVTFIKSNDGECKIECVETEKISHEVTVSDGTLRLITKDTTKWFDFMKFGNWNLTTKVYLPETTYENIKVSNKTGSITMPKDFSFTTANVDNSTGSITWKANVTNDFTAINQTGSIKISDSVFGSIDAKASTGSINMDNVTVNALLKAKCSTGSINIKDSTMENLTLECSTGSIKLEEAVASKHMDLETTTGSIKGTEIDAETIDGETDTGSIKLSLLTSKIFDCRSDTGSVHTPESDVTKGLCKLRSDTGSITVTIA